MTAQEADSTLQCFPLTPERWGDFETLFGPNGACAGCWCMWWRLAQGEWKRQKGEGNRLAMMALVEGGEVPGLLAYRDGTPVGWCSVAPREHYPALERSKDLARVDATPVWSVVCFFVHRRHRRQGVSEQLLRAAIAYVREQGGSCLEAYPYVPKTERVSAGSAYMGMASTYARAGFVEVARRSATRPIVRYVIHP